MNELINKKKSHKQKQKICRICYMGEDESETITNPLIKPCNCSGSMKYIHFMCLLNWLKSRCDNSQVTSGNNASVYVIKDIIDCELCKKVLPDFIKHNNRVYNLMNYSKTEENYNKSESVNFNILDSTDNYIIIDTLYPLSDGNKYRYIIKFDHKNNITIGRSIKSNLILNEITVSRNHCILSLKKNVNGNYEVELEDNDSKFGTLILIQSPQIEILKNQTFELQISNFFLRISYIKKFFFSCCNVESIDQKISYSKINEKAIKEKYGDNIVNEAISDDEINNKKNEDNSDIKSKNISESNNNENEEENEGLEKPLLKENCIN